MVTQNSPTMNRFLLKIHAITVRKKKKIFFPTLDPNDPMVDVSVPSSQLNGQEPMRSVRAHKTFLDKYHSGIDHEVSLVALLLFLLFLAQALNYKCVFVILNKREKKTEILC